MKRRKVTLVPLLLVTAAMVMLIAACGGSSDTTSTDTGGSTEPASTPTETPEEANGGGDAVAEAEAALEAIAGPKGSYTSPPTSGPKAESGKSIFVVSYGQGIPYFNELTKVLKEATDSIGWSVQIWDGKFEPNEWLAGVRQGVTSKADGIIGLGIDCPTVTPGLEAAEAAGIPFVSIEGFDCDELKSGAKSRFSWTVTYNEGGLTEWLKQVGEYQALWAIAHTEGKAKTINFEETDANAFRVLIEGFENGMKTCPECEVLDTVQLTGLDYGPTLEQKAQQALLSNPDADIVFPSGSESVLDGGVGAAIRSSTGKPVSTGAEGSPSSKDNLESGILGMTQNETPGWEAYSAVDALVRIFAGEEPTAETGNGLRLIDEEHNLEDYEPYVAPIEYKSVYEKTWGAG